MTRGVVFLVCIPTSSHEHELIYGVPIERDDKNVVNTEKCNSVSHPNLDLDLRHKKRAREPLTINKSKLGALGDTTRRKINDFISMETVSDLLNLIIL